MERSCIKGFAIATCINLRNCHISSVNLKMGSHKYSCCLSLPQSYTILNARLNLNVNFSLTNNRLIFTTERKMRSSADQLGEPGLQRSFSSFKSHHHMQYMHANPTAHHPLSNDPISGAYELYTFEILVNPPSIHNSHGKNLSLTNKKQMMFT